MLVVVLQHLLRGEHRAVGRDHHGDVRPVDVGHVVVVLVAVAQGELRLGGGAAGANVRRAYVVRLRVMADPRQAAVEPVAPGAGPDGAAPADVRLGLVEVVAEGLSGLEHAVRVARLLRGEVPEAADAHGTRVVDGRLAPCVAVRLVRRVLSIPEGDPVGVRGVRVAGVRSERVLAGREGGGLRVCVHHARKAGVKQG